MFTTTRAATVRKVQEANGCEDFLRSLDRADRRMLAMKEDFLYQRIASGSGRPAAATSRYFEVLAQRSGHRPAEQRVRDVAATT